MEALGYARYWLDEHPGELLILMLEPSVPAWAIELQFKRAGLLDRVARATHGVEDMAELVVAG